MFKLEKEMPSFLKYNSVLVEKGPYFKRSSSNISFLSPAYLTTTENLNGYYDGMNFEGKSILTVIGASDHVFNAVLRGSKKVDGFDISMYAIMFYYLKEAALKALDYEEFISFLYYPKKYFNKKTYNVILPYLNSKAVPFWNLIFSYKNPQEIITSSHFCWRSFITDDLNITINSLKKVSSFLSKENFYILKEKIKNCEIRIFLEDVNSLDNIDGKYDYIILSNIIDYVEDKEKFFQSIERYNDKLNDFGEIKVAYVYQSPYKYTDRYDVTAIDSFGRAITGDVTSENYILTKKKNN